MRDGLDPEEDRPAGKLGRALAANPEARESIGRADGILGVDVRDPGHQALFFGRAALQRIARSGKEQDLNISEIWVDFSTDDVEELIAACIAIKGSSCYGGGSLINPRFN
jgi:hypothetical protein